MNGKFKMFTSLSEEQYAENCKVYITLPCCLLCITQCIVRYAQTLSANKTRQLIVEKKNKNL